MKHRINRVSLLQKLIFQSLFVFLFVSNISSHAEIIQLPAEIRAEIIEGVNSERVEVGDKIGIRIYEPINLASQSIFVPAGAIFGGEVVDVYEARRGLRSGKVKVVFNRIYFPNGFTLETEALLLGTDSQPNFLMKIPNEEYNLDNKISPQPSKRQVLSQKFKMQDGGIVKGKSSLSENLFKVAKVGTGAILGGPVGAAISASTLIFEKGGKVRIKPNETVRVYILKIWNNNSANTQINNTQQGNIYDF